MKNENKRHRHRINLLKQGRRIQETDKRKETTMLVMRAVDGVATMAERIRLRDILEEAKERIEDRKRKASGE